MFPNTILDIPDRTNHHFDRHQFRALFNFNYITQNRYQSENDKRLMMTTTAIRRSLQICYCRSIWDNVLMRYRKCYEDDCVRVLERTECDIDCGEGCENRPFIDNVFATRSLGLLYKPIVNFGLITNLPIQEGEIVIEYIGDVIRKQQYPQHRNTTYRLDLRRTEFCICPLTHGNLARFANHSHDPNMICWDIFTDNQIRVVLKALRNIRAGEELTWSYGDSYHIESCQCGAEACPNINGLDDAVADHYRSRQVEIDNGWVYQHHQVEPIFPAGYVSDQEDDDKEEESNDRITLPPELPTHSVAKTIQHPNPPQRFSPPPPPPPIQRLGHASSSLLSESDNQQYKQEGAAKSKLVRLKPTLNIAKKRIMLRKAHQQKTKRHQYILVKRERRNILMRHASTQFPDLQNTNKDNDKSGSSSTQHHSLYSTKPMPKQTGRLQTINPSKYTLVENTIKGLIQKAHGTVKGEQTAKKSSLFNAKISTTQSSNIQRASKSSINSQHHSFKYMEPSEFDLFNNKENKNNSHPSKPSNNNSSTSISDDPTIYCCETCEECFSDYSNYRRHTDTHNNPDVYQCKNCPKTFINIQKFKRHQRFHKQQNQDTGLSTNHAYVARIERNSQQHETINPWMSGSASSTTTD